VVRRLKLNYLIMILIIIIIIIIIIKGANVIRKQAKHAIL